MYQPYKAYLRECIRKLESKLVKTNEELEALEELRDKLDCHQTYLNESGMAYEQA